MAEKLPPCCAKFCTSLVREEAALRQDARRANHRAARGLSCVAEQAAIAQRKTNIAAIKRAIEDHEAEHAGGE